MKGFFNLKKNIKSYKNNINVFYFFENFQGLETVNNSLNINSGEIIWNGLSIKETKSKEYYKETLLENKKILIMDLDKILKNFIDEKKKNIVIVSAHGGIFQSFIDLSTSPAIAMNTVNFCNIINKYKIDLLFLDMCAMNYLEIFYELIFEEKIKKIVTYKNQAPLESMNYNKFLKVFEENNFEIAYEKFFYGSNEQLIACEIENKEKLKDLKILLNDLAKKCFLEKYPNFESDLKKFKDYLFNVIECNNLAKNSKEPGINFIKFYLGDKVDRLIYNSYKITNNNFWKLLVSDKSKNENKIKEVIILSLENIEHLIWLYNPTLKKAEIEKLVLNFLEIRAENQYYKNS